MENQIKKIIVVGRDADAWISALMLQLSFAKSETPVDVHLIELPSRLHIHDIFSVLPSHKVLHKVLGINEGSVFKTSGQYSLGQRFVNWNKNTDYFHSYDSYGVNFGRVDFFQYWIKAQKKGLNVPLEAFSLGAEAAKQGRFVVFGESASAFSKATHGYHLSAIPYLKMIAKTAIAAGVHHQAKEISNVEIVDGKIKSLKLDDGQSLEADFYVDASGEEARLISQIEDKSNFENWQKWLPCDRQIMVSAPPLSPAPAFSQIVALEEGWMSFSPLLNRSALTAVYSSAHSTFEKTAKAMQANARAALGGFVERPFISGARKKSWIGNCLSLGTSAVSLEALDATQLHILHIGLSLLRSLFPTNKLSMPEAHIFNDKMASFVGNVRDFTIAHYKLNQRNGEEFWGERRVAEVPETLQRKIQLFAKRGVVSLQEDETFQEENWTSIFVGHGLIPETYDPLVDKMPHQEHVEQFQRLLQYIGSEIENMPTIEAHIEMNSDTTYQSMF